MTANVGKADKKIRFKHVIGWMAFFTVISNVLVLVMPLYMTQVYDRVLPSNSLETLLFLSLIAAAALAVFGATESVRQKLSQKLSARYELVTLPALMNAAANGRGAGELSVPAQKAGVVKRFISSPAFVGLFDLPFAPLFLGLMFLAHPLLGWLTVGGMVTLSIATWLNQWASNNSMEKSGTAQARAGRFASDALGRIEDVKAMGMGAAMVYRWRGAAVVAAVLSDKVSHINASFFGLVRFIRQTIQMLVLGVGAYLVITGQMSASLIFAASLVSSRALLPVEQLIGSWRQISEAYRAQRDVQAAIANAQQIEAAQLELPPARGLLEARRVSMSLDPSANAPMLLKDIDFAVRPGELVAIIGASGSGKSTFARILSGGAAPSSGEVKLDGFRLEQWPPAHRGRYIGYVGQDTALMEGTVAENIARFDPAATDAVVLEAAQASEAHAFIGTLPEGYNTRVGSGGVRLSGGQVQRVALARALYGNPAVLILDEPNAHLDSAGEETLLRVLQSERAKGRAIVVVTHRANILSIANHVMVMEQGRLQPFSMKPAKPQVVAPEPIVLRQNISSINLAPASASEAETKGIAQ